MAASRRLSLTARTELEPSAVSLLTISRDRAGALEVAGRSWQADGLLSARYWSEGSKERLDPASIFYFWKGNVPVTRTLRNSRGPVRSSSRAPSGRRLIERRLGEWKSLAKF